MSLYYNNFRYLDKNSLDQGLIVSSFEPDDGFTDSFLSMELIQEDYYDGTKKFDYGARYDTTAVINITVVKSNGADFSLSETRSMSKWLTGSKVNSWLDVGPTKFEDGKDDDENIKYAFLGRVTNLQPRKMDGRTVAFKIEFTSVSPWAFSTPKSFYCIIGQQIDLDNAGILSSGTNNESKFWLDNEGYVHPIEDDHSSYFNISDDGIIYIESEYSETVDNQSDDLYTYIYLDVKYENQSGSWVKIKNATIDEITEIKNVVDNEIIQISARQFIISNTANKLFGDNFNFVWPKLQPGENEFTISGDGTGSLEFTYRYPMKVGDCAMDISVYGGGNSNCGEMASYETVKWENIIGTPTSLKGYGITDAYTMDEIDDKLQKIDMDVEWDDISNKPTTVGGYGITDAYTMKDVYTKVEVDDMIDDIEISGGVCTGDVRIDEEDLNNMLADILG